MSLAGRWGLAAVGVFVVLSVATLVAWEAADRNPVTGDEPHYLVMADSLVSDRSIEVTDAYEREFRDADIYSPGLAPAGARPDRENAHAVNGDRGAFSVHSYGLPAIVALPFAIGGVFLAKLTTIAIAAAGGWVAWRMSERHAGSAVERSTALAVVMGAMGFVIASTQLYPDLPAGVLALAGLAAIQRREVNGESNEGDQVDDDGRVHPALIVGLLAVMPWLHIKTAAAAVLLTAVLVVQEWRRHHDPKRSALTLTPLAVSGVALIAYNAWAFGQATGPYSDGALQIGGMPVTVFAGLYVDQFQGMFVQNPALLVALVALVPFVRRFPMTGAALVVTHLSFVVPNAMHENWYGGFSLAGRFGVSGAMVLVPVAVFGISEALARRRTVLPIVLLGLLAVYQGVQFVRYAIAGRDLYNDLRVLPEVYPSHLPALRSVLPMFYRAEWALRFAPNVAALIACAALLVVGAMAWTRRSSQGLIRSRGVALLAFAVIAVVVGAAAASEPHTVIRTPGRALEVANGERRGEIAVATGDGGIVTFGPYVRVGDGPHSFEVRYRAEVDRSLDDEIAGDWVLRAVGVDDALGNGALIGADTMLVDGLVFDVPTELAGRQFELQTATPPDVELDVIEVVIQVAASSEP